MAGSLARSVIPQPLSLATYNASNQQVSFGNQTLTYDLNGNLLSDGANSYIWNARNRLLSMTGPGVDASFQYDAAGRRINKTVNGITTSFLHDGANIVQEQSAQNGNANLLNGGLDELFLRSASSGNWSPLADGLGSALSLTDASGVVQTEYSYGAFGTSASTGIESNHSAQYTGRENDNTGLYYYRARYYSPTLQRFISQDPIGLAGGDVNFYAYVRNNPITLKDPFGLDPCDELRRPAPSTPEVAAGAGTTAAVEAAGSSAMSIAGGLGGAAPDLGYYILYKRCECKQIMEICCSQKMGCCERRR